MKKIIVTTTINKPTKALHLFNNLKDWHLIVIGDKKTPHKLYKDFNYIHPDEQENKYPVLSKLIGWNCIQRRNIGLLEAYKQGADVIATIDDDNIPYEFWGELKIGKLIKGKEYDIDLPCFDPFSVTNHNNLWHRGFPIQYLKEKNKITTKSDATLKPDAQINFWNGEPDVDAICRFINKTNCNRLIRKILLFQEKRLKIIFFFHI